MLNSGPSVMSAPPDSPREHDQAVSGAATPSPPRAHPRRPVARHRRRAEYAAESRSADRKRDWPESNRSSPVLAGRLRLAAWRHRCSSARRRRWSGTEHPSSSNTGAPRSERSAEPDRRTRGAPAPCRSLGYSARRRGGKRPRGAGGVGRQTEAERRAMRLRATGRYGEAIAGDRRNRRPVGTPCAKRSCRSRRSRHHARRRSQVVHGAAPRVMNQVQQSARSTDVAAGESRLLARSLGAACCGGPIARWTAGCRNTMHRTG